MGDPSADVTNYIQTLEREKAQLTEQISTLKAQGQQILKEQQDTIQTQQAMIASLQTSAPPSLVPGTPLLPKGVKTPCIDHFSGNKGEDLNAWIFQAEEYFSLVGITEDTVKIMYAGTVFRHHAKTWYNSVRGPTVPSEDKIHDWNIFTRTLLSHFSPVDPAKLARDELANLRQTGSVRDYTTQFRNLCAIIRTIHEDEKLDRYVRGLRPKIRNELHMRNPSTYLEATQLAERMDTNLDRTSFFHPIPPPPVYDAPTPMDLNMMRHGPQRQYRPRLTEAEKQSRRDKGQCLYCGNPNHKILHCPVKPKPPVGNGQWHPPGDA